MVRVHLDFDNFLERYAVELTKNLNKPVTKTEASRILASQNMGLIVIKRKRKDDTDYGFGRFINL